MGRNKHNKSNRENRRNNSQVKPAMPAAAAAAIAAPTPEAKVEQLSNAAISNATEEDLVQLPTVSPPLGANLHDLLKKAEEARMLFEIEKERLQRNNAALT